MKESRPRSALKGISWRLIATLTTMTLVFLFTDNLKLSLRVGIFEVLAKIIFYYFHERLWNKVKWGKHENKTKTAN